MALLSERAYAIETSRQRTLVIVPTILTFFAVLFVCLRLYARRLKKTKILLEDYLCIFATILCVANLAGDIVMVVSGGGGNSLANLKDPMKDYLVWFQLLIATYLIWITGITALQIAILIFYQRVFGVKRSFKILCYAVMALVGAWFVAGFVADLTICHPITYVFNPFTEGSCGNGIAMCSSVGIVHIVFDFTILIMPIPLIWKLQTPRFNKIALTIILSVGVFASISSILRLQCLLQLTGFQHDDYGASTWEALLFQFIELPTGIVCICVPTLAPVWVEISNSRIASAAKRMLSRSKPSTDGSKESVGWGSRDRPHGAGTTLADFKRLDESMPGHGHSVAEIHRADSEEIPLKNTDSTGHGDGILVSQNVQVTPRWGIEH